MSTQTPSRDLPSAAARPRTEPELRESFEWMAGEFEKFADRHAEGPHALSVALCCLRNIYENLTITQNEALSLVRTLRKCDSELRRRFEYDQDFGLMSDCLSALVDLAALWSAAPRDRRRLAGAPMHHLWNQARYLQNRMHNACLEEDIAAENERSERQAECSSYAFLRPYFLSAPLFLQSANEVEA